MQKRETFKDVEINGRRFRVGKFDALTGSYVAFLLMTQILPAISRVMGKEGQLPANALEELVSAAPGMLMSMDKKKFMDLQKDCLSVCSEISTVGANDIPTMIILSSGEWGVPDLKNDTVSVLMLTIHTLAFNVMGFFEDGALKLPDSLKGLSLFNAPT